MLMRKPQHRKFEYVPRFYDPTKDPEERRKRKLGFRNYRKHGRKGKSNIIIWLVAIVIILWFILKYSN
jgi:hypothetical protein